MKIVQYDSNGKIHSVQTMDDLSMSDDYRAFLGEEGVLYLPSVFTAHISDVKHYVNDSTVMERPTSTVYLDGATLCNVRENATVIIDGVSYEADGSEIELEFSHPGTYQLAVKDWPFLDWEGTYEN